MSWCLGELLAPGTLLGIIASQPAGASRACICPRMVGLMKCASVVSFLAEKTRLRLTEIVILVV